MSRTPPPRTARPHERFVIGRVDLGDKPGTGSALITIAHEGRVDTYTIDLLGITLGTKAIIAVSGLPESHSNDAEIYAALVDAFLERTIEEAKRQARYN